MGGGGGGEVQKKISRKGKLHGKKYCTPIYPKKYSCYCLKKIHTRPEFDNEKKKIPAARKLASAHNFSNGPSLRYGIADKEVSRVNVFVIVASFTFGTACVSPLHKMQG